MSNPLEIKLTVTAAAEVIPAALRKQLVGGAAIGWAIPLDVVEAHFRTAEDFVAVARRWLESEGSLGPEQVLVVGQHLPGERAWPGFARTLHLQIHRPEAESSCRLCQPIPLREETTDAADQ